MQFVQHSSGALVIVCFFEFKLNNKWLSEMDISSEIYQAGLALVHHTIDVIVSFDVIIVDI